MWKYLPENVVDYLSLKKLKDTLSNVKLDQFTKCISHSRAYIYFSNNVVALFIDYVAYNAFKFSF